MGLRFRRSVRLFPGVRLNFSRSGLSTSIGVRGATMTLGPRGAYANVGVPGSGLSYRTRLDTPAHTRQPVPEPVSPWTSPPQSALRSPIRAPGVSSIPGTEVEVKSADVGVLTSPGLGELKQLINDATIRHSELRSQLAQRKKTLDRAAGRLRLAQSLVIRVFTEKSIPSLVDAANKADDEVDETRAYLEGCFLEVDFAFDDATRDSFAALVRAFEALRTAQRIWDVTSTAAVDRVTQRTTAYSALTRVPLAFDFTSSEIIRSQYRAMRLGSVAGRDLQIFPGFVMMREASRDFALIEFPQFECELANSNFIEEGTVPSDAEQIGATWKRANKDGSRDRRFNDNYQIPVLRYAELALSSATGLAKVYQISSYAKAAAFAQAVAAHKRAITKLNNTPIDTLALPVPSDDRDGGAEGLESTPAFVARPPKSLVVDWVVLALMVAGIGFGGISTAQHWVDISAAFAPPLVEAVPAPAPPPSQPVVHKGRHHRHHTIAASPALTEAPPIETAPAKGSPEPAAEPQQTSQP